MFMDYWTEARALCIADRHERSPTELLRFVKMYLLKKWDLVAFGITTAIPYMLEGGFVGS